MLLINDIVAFVIEIASIILYGMIAYQIPNNRIVKILFVIVSIVLFALIWGRFFAPSAANPLQGWIRWLLEFIILFLPWVIYFHKKHIYIMIASIIIIANLAIQAFVGRSNFG